MSQSFESICFTLASVPSSSAGEIGQQDEPLNRILSAYEPVFTPICFIISDTTQPTDQTSAFSVYSLFWNISSGGLQYLVKQIGESGLLAPLALSGPIRFSVLAKPKSHSLIVHCSVIKIFDGFKSLCIIFAVWRNQSVRSKL